MIRVMKYTIVTITLIFCVILSACGAKTPQPEGKKELVFWTLQLSAYEDYIKSVIADYESQHPDIKIKWQDVPFKEGEKRALASVMSNNVPDVINLNPAFSSTLASKKALINFNEYLSEEEKEKYLEAAFDACTLGDFLYGIPWYITSSITIYNKEDLQKVSISEVPRTYSMLMDQARVIQESLQKEAFFPSLTDGNYFLKILHKEGVGLVQNQNGEYIAIFANDKAVNVLEKWVSLYKDRLIASETIVSSHSDAVDKFQAGVNTYINIGPNFLKSIADNAPELYKSIDVAPQITGETGLVDFSVMNLVVPLKSQHKEESVDFILFLTNANNQVEFSKLTPTLPSVKQGLDNPFFNQEKANTLEDKARIISANQLKKGAVSLPVVPNQKELYAIFNYYLQKAFLGELSPELALKSAEEEWNKNLSR